MAELEKWSVERNDGIRQVISYPSMKLIAGNLDKETAFSIADSHNEVLDSLQKRDALKREQLLQKMRKIPEQRSQALLKDRFWDAINEVLADEVDEGTSSLLGFGTEHKGEGQ